MNASLVDRRARWRLSVSSSGSGSGTYPGGVTHSHRGQIKTWSAVDFYNEDLAVKILVTSDTGTNERVATLDIPRLGISHTETVSGAGTIAAYVEIEGHAVHVFGIMTSNGLHPAWRVSWTVIKFYVQGSLVATWTSGSNEQSPVELFFQPSSIIITGGPPLIETFGSFGVGAGLPETSSYDYSATGNHSATGGWSFEPVGHGSLIERLVSLMPFASVDQSGNPWTLGGSTYAAGSQSGSITVYGYYYRRDKRTVPPTTGAGDVFAEWEDYRGSARIFTVEERKLWRLNASYRALLERYGSPRTKSVTTVQKFEIAVEGGVPDDPVLVATTTGEIDLTPERTDMLRVVGAAEDSVFEDVLGFVPYAPVTVQHKKGQLSYTFEVTVTPGPHGDIILVEQGDGSGTEVVYEAGYQCQDRIENPDLPAFLDHRYPWVRAWNMLAHPFWWMAHHFPTNAATYWQPVEGVNVKSYDWPEDDEIGYWIPTFTQWLTHPALPEGERRRTRNSLRTNALQQGPFANWWKGAAWGRPTHPLGICRFAVESPSVPASLTMTSASSPLWTATNCTITHGSSMTIAFTGGPAMIELDLGSWDGELRMHPHYSNEFGIGWDAANVDAIDSALVGIDGSTAQIGTTPGSYLRPIGPATKFTGSWAKDHSADTAVSDTGADIGPNGISVATMSSPERSLAPQLLPGRGAEKLRLTIVPINPANPVTIHYPTFKKPTGKIRVVPLDHQHTAMVFERGPGLLLGTLDWWDRIDNEGTGDVPNLAIWARRSNMDVFTYQKLKNVLFLGKPADDLLTSRLAALYDSVEGQDPIDAAHDTMAIPIGVQDGIKWLLYNTWQIPPMAAFPHPKRDTTTLELKAPLELTNEVWDWAEENRYYPSPATISVDQYSPPDTWTALSPLSVEGWKIVYHAHPVTNDEANDFRVIYKGEDLAIVSPWFGYLCIRDFDEAGGVAMASCLQTGSLYAIVFGGGIRVVRLRPFPAGEYDIPALAGESIASAGITLPRDGKILVSYVGSADGTYLIQSGGNETSWEAPMLIDAGGKATAIEANPSGKECAIASYHGGAWHLYMRWDETKPFELVDEIVTAPLGHAGLTWQTSGSLMLIFGYSDGAETRYLRSGDYGLNWEAV